MKRFLLLIAVLACAAGAKAQTSTDIQKKLSISTQMFIDERDGEVSFERDVKAEQSMGLIRTGEAVVLKGGPRQERWIASPDTIDGVAKIAAFVRLNDTQNVSDLEALGVEVQCEFLNGLVSTLIPVDQIEAVAALANVKRINVSTLMQPTTYKARQATNVDDVLTNSDDAQNACLEKGYDGTGVLVGVIDTGIDFQHIAFKDADGNSRIKGAYVYNGSKATEYSSITSSSPTTDDKSGDHGTHTSSTAGGSSVIISGSNVTVTNDHANATCGGMAPGSDLYLAGIKDLSTTYLSNAFDKIISYADENDMPVVVSNSWGSQVGPHDGTGDFADVVNKYFGDKYPNHICVFAASNDAGKSKDGEGGGYHISGTATSSSPLSTIVRSASYSNTDAGYYYYGPIANAWTRNQSSASLACKIFVLDASTGAVKTSVTVTSQGAVDGLSSYYKGTLYAYYDYISTGNGKKQLMLYTSGLTSRSTNETTKDEATYYTSAYTLAVQFYPTSGSEVIDVWGGNYGYFTDYLTTSDYTWTAGNDDNSVSDEATFENSISIGAYVTANTWTDYTGTEQDMSDTYTLGDIAYFSSYATVAESPTGKAYPWISAPGARLAAGVNHYHTSSVDDYNYIDGDYKTDRINANTTYPYAMMEGTSMATPTAAGIVALWLQAAKEVGKELTVSDVKTIMRETAITDDFTTTGANASHFGYGKIDALVGLASILGDCSKSQLKGSPANLELEALVDETATATFTVTGKNLTSDVTLKLNDETGYYTISQESIAVAEDGTVSATITVTYTPGATGEHDATISLVSAGTDDDSRVEATVTLSGTATIETGALELKDPTYDYVKVTESEFTAEWTDETKASYVKDYTLYVTTASTTEETTTTETKSGNATVATATWSNNQMTYSPDDWSTTNTTTSSGGMGGSSSKGLILGTTTRSGGGGGSTTTNAGTMTTPSTLDFSDVSDTDDSGNPYVTVKVTGMGYASGGGGGGRGGSSSTYTVQVYSGSNTVQSGTFTSTSTSSTLTFQVPVTKATNQSITVASTSSGRIVVSAVTVSKNYSYEETTTTTVTTPGEAVATITGIAYDADAKGGTQEVTDLSELTDYEYYVVANYIDGSTQTSETKTFTTGAANTISALEYSTLYYSTAALIVPTSSQEVAKGGATTTTALTAKGYGVNESGYLAETSTKNAGDVICAGEAVVLNGDAGKYIFYKSSEEGTRDANNLLLGFDEGGQTTVAKDGTTGGHYFYKLTTKNKQNIGFYWGAAGGAAFTMKNAHKAYLVLDNTFTELQAAADGTSVKGAFTLAEIATGISAITADKDETATGKSGIYTVTGVRLNDTQNLPAGVYIVNGKKVYIK